MAVVLAFRSSDRLKVELKDGTSVDIGFANNKPASVSQLLRMVNEADPSKLEMRIATNGDGFELIDKTTGTAEPPLQAVLQISWDLPASMLLMDRSQGGEFKGRSKVHCFPRFKVAKESELLV
jgi:hypothetical protein